MKIFVSFISILFLFSFFSHDNLQAQSVEFGFRLETLGIQRNYPCGENNFVYYPLPVSLQINLAIYPIEDLAVEIRGGRLFFFDNFSGYEYGIYCKYYIANKYYIIAGLSGHSNEGEGGGIYSGSVLNTIIMPSLGFGIKPWKITSIELLFQKANNNRIGWSTPDSFQTICSERVDWLFKFGIAFGWLL